MLYLPRFAPPTLEDMKKLPARIALVFAGLATSIAAQVEVTVLPTARVQATDWQYVTEAPALEWTDPAFDASAWQTGTGGFGTDGTPGAVIGTVWSGSEIWLRKKFNLTGVAALENLAWKIHHDEAVEVYLNGSLVALMSGYTTEYTTFPMTVDAISALKEGENVLAVHCSQSEGGQFIDVGIVQVKTVQLVDILADSRQGPQSWLYTTTEPGSSNWMANDFTPDGWGEGVGGFGTLMDGMDVTVTAGTSWSSPDIWLRKKFLMPEKTFSDFFINIFYDEDVEVFLNGTFIYSRKGYTVTYKQDVLAKEFSSLFVPGENLIAVHCKQTVGGQYIDLGIQGVESVPTAIARPGAGLRGANQGIVLRNGRSGTVGVQRPGRAALYDFNGRWSRRRR